MDYIFIDTSVWESENFMEGRTIKQLLKWSEYGELKIILPEIIQDEIKNRISKNILKSHTAFKNFKSEARLLRNLEKYRVRFEPMEKNECIDELYKTLDLILKKSKVKIIPYTELPTKELFDSYFNKKAPFGEGQKKDEFPDAMSLMTLEKWAKENSRNVIILSKDSDLYKYKGSSLTYWDYKKYVDEKLRELDDKKLLIEDFEKLFKEERRELEEKVQSWLEDELNDGMVYAHHINYMDIHDLTVKYVSALFTDYHITSITDEIITIDATAQVEYTVQLEYDDDDDFYYDDEEKTFHYLNTQSEEIQRDEYIPIQLIYRKTPSGIYEIRIESINNNKPFRI